MKILNLFKSKNNRNVAYICIYDLDCPKAPSIKKTTSTGSVQIGGKMVYTCTQPFDVMNGQGYVQCGWMNTWSSAKDIACSGTK